MDEQTTEHHKIIRPAAGVLYFVENFKSKSYREKKLGNKHHFKN